MFAGRHDEVKKPCPNYSRSQQAPTRCTTVCGPRRRAAEPFAQARRFTERLWERTAGYVDTDLPAKAAQHFHQAFWEMYLAATLLEAGLPMIPRTQRKNTGAGPDLQIAPNIWVEAIAVTGGCGPDAVPAHDADSKAHDVPDRELRCAWCPA